ncbi:MAG: 2-C-methyl-D-erythritol 4-phosphate cytidylyltransferase [Clostridia bacterium]|nr:2-C-methyl-D-erythritol 4-phosphate cytidylyltransferase [Clostridia bacterium]
MKKNIGVVLAGGSGVRFGSSLPKQYQQINQKDVIGYVIDAFRESASIDDVFVVAHHDYISYVNEKFQIDTIAGGDNRNITVYNALQHICSNFPDCENVVFADSARPLLKPNVLDDICELLNENDAVITTAKITDSLGYKDNSLVDRNDYYLVQTPEAFRIECLKGFKPDSDATAIIQQSTCRNVYHYDKMLYNLKITYPDDLIIAKALLEVIK